MKLVENWLEVGSCYGHAHGASFDVKLVSVEKQIVFIVDLNGDKSVTNDAEAVVAKLHSVFPGYRIVYRDTQNDWDELVHRNGTFVTFRPTPNRKEFGGGL